MSALRFAVAFLGLTASLPAWTFDWTMTELQAQYAALDKPDFIGGGQVYTRSLELRHGNGWKYGDTYFFVDYLASNVKGFNDDDYYGEFYLTFSSNKLRKISNGSGLVRDLGFTAAINQADDAHVRKVLYGIRLDLNLGKADFANLMFARYVDDSEGVTGGGAPAETDSFIIDLSWARRFSIGRHDYFFDGHVEYVGSRHNEFGDNVAWHVLAQPQVRYDLGKTLLHKSGQLYAGMELQIWLNKLGEASTDEMAAKVIVAWRF